MNMVDEQARKELAVIGCHHYPTKPFSPGEPEISSNYVYETSDGGQLVGGGLSGMKPSIPVAASDGLQPETSFVGLERMMEIKFVHVGVGGDIEP